MEGPLPVMRCVTENDGTAVRLLHSWTGEEAQQFGIGWKKLKLKDAWSKGAGQRPQVIRNELALN